MEVRKPVCPFISSTFRDFQEERDHLVKYIFPEIQQICKEKYCTHFAPIDLRWGINKNQAQKGEVISLCIDFIKRGSPWFICLLGDRYGYHYDAEAEDEQAKEWFMKNIDVAAKEGHEWVRQCMSKSITEIEIEAALSEDFNCTQCFFYFRDEDYVYKKFPNPTEEQLKTYCSESEKSAKRLRALKQRIKDSNYKVTLFSSPLQLGEALLSDLKQALEEYYKDCHTMTHFPHLPDSFTERVHNLAPENREMILAHHIFETSRGDSAKLADFGDDIITKLNNHAYSIGQSSHKPILLLSGEQGCGKSTLMARWALQYNSTVPLITHYIGCSTYSRDLAHTLENVLQILGIDVDDSTSNEPLTACTSKQWSELQDNIEHFNRIVQEQTFVLAIDCLEALSSDSDHAHVLEDFTWLPSSIPDNCRIILTCTKGSNHYLHFKSNYNSKGKSNFVEVEIGGITDVEQRKAVVTKHLETYCKSLDPGQLATICNSHLSYNPMYLIAVANELRVFGIYEEVDKLIDEIVQAPTQDQLWFNIFKRWCRDYGWSDEHENTYRPNEPFGWVQDALCFIAMSRRGLSEEEILGALELIGYRDSSKVTTAAWASFYRAAQDSLIKEYTGIYSLAHGCVQKAVLCSVMGGSVDNLTTPLASAAPHTQSKLCRMPSIYKRSHDFYHIQLANYFEKQPTTWRVLEELPWHWCMAHKWDKLHRIVRTPQYFQLFRSSSEINQFNTFKIDLFRYWDEMKQHSDHLPSETYKRMVKDELESAIRTSVEETMRIPEVENDLGTCDIERLVELASIYVPHDDIIKLTKISWLAGQFLGEICDYEPGTKLLQHAKILCPGKHSTLLYQINYSLGKVYYYKIDWEKARGSFIEALKELKKSSDSKWDTLEEQCALLNNTVSCLLIMKRLNEADRILKETEEKYLKISNYKKSPGYFMYLFNKSRLLVKRANKIKNLVEKKKLLTEAVNLFEETLEFRMRHYGWRHPLVALNWQEKGFLYHQWGNREQGEICFKKALEIYEEVLSQDHVLIATCYYHLGMIYEEDRNWSQGLRCFEIALKIRQSRFTRKTVWLDIQRRIRKCEKLCKLQEENDIRSNSAPPPVTLTADTPPDSPSAVPHRRLERHILNPYQRYSLFDTDRQIAIPTSDLIEKVN